MSFGCVNFGQSPNSNGYGNVEMTINMHSRTAWFSFESKPQLACFKLFLSFYPFQTLCNKLSFVSQFDAVISLRITLDVVRDWMR